KTTLSQKTLNDSLEGISDITKAGMNSVPFFKGIFAFKSKIKSDKVVKIIKEFYQENQILSIHNHVDVVCVPGLNSFIVDYSNLDNDDYSCPSLLEVENFKGLNVEESIFFQKLFSFLEVEKT